MVTTVDSMGNEVDLTDQYEIEKAILENNKKKFTQSTHTPFYLPPLRDEFGFNGLTSAAQTTSAVIYESNYDIDARILDVIAQWKMPEVVRDLGPLTTDMSLEA